MNPILQQAPSYDETLSSAAEFFRTFGISWLFNRSARTGKGIPPLRILQFLFALVFLRKIFFDASPIEGRGDAAQERPALEQGHVPTASSRNSGSTGGVSCWSSQRGFSTPFFSLSPWRVGTGYWFSTIPHTRGTGAKRWSSCRSATTTATIAISGGSACSPSAGRTEDPFCLWPSRFLLRRRRRTGSSTPERPTEEQGARTDGKKR